MEQPVLVFTIDSQHLTDPQDNNTESMCGQPVQGELSEILTLADPTCERCLRIFADRISKARQEEATHA